MQTFNGFTNEGTGHSLTFQTYTCVIIKVIQTIVIPTKLSISSPDIRSFPVINGIKIIHIIGNLGSPLIIVIKLLLQAAINGTPAIITFLCTYTHQTSRTDSLFLFMQPGRKAQLELIIPHILMEERKILCFHDTFRHLPHPYITKRLVPRTPVMLIHGSTGSHLKGNTNPIYLQYVLILFQNAIDKCDGMVILHLIIHEKYTKLYLQIVPAYIINAKIQQYSTILSTGK